MANRDSFEESIRNRRVLCVQRPVRAALASWATQDDLTFVAAPAKGYQQSSNPASAGLLFSW